MPAANSGPSCAMTCAGRGFSSRFLLRFSLSFAAAAAAVSGGLGVETDDTMSASVISPRARARRMWRGHLPSPSLVACTRCFAASARSFCPSISSEAAASTAFAAVSLVRNWTYAHPEADWVALSRTSRTSTTVP
eukprot:Amastigsp_a676889_94.p5 type:complete len:135 gc:universal Amastigsp_a676889_94:419-823(+)